ncbi:MAG: alkaline phosphatase family protein [Candidatus Rokubacteria bacterium]|nr:alkaline phosphatase family protein [Candidatus Rokubacteria bacterium]
MSARRAALLLAIVAVLYACAAVKPAPPPSQRHVVLISVDALRPEFYLDGMFEAPALRALVAGGSAARAAEGVFPTVTYPNHTTIVTGVRPHRHGILYNMTFDPERGRDRWYEQASDLKATTLWHWAREAGLTTASVSWPVTVGASIDLLLAERDYWARKEPLEDLRAASTPGLFDRLGVQPAAGMFKDVEAWDRFLTDTAVAMIRQARPNLLLVHLVQMDLTQHRQGRDGVDVPAALRRVDGHVAAILGAVTEAGLGERTTVIVAGDHGFETITRTVELNAILARAGLGGCPSRDPTWRAAAHASGGAAAIFLRDPADATLRARTEQALRGEAGDRYRLVSRAQLDELGAMPGAALAVEAAPGYALGGACGRTVEHAARGGTHGYLPSRPLMATGFIASGRGVRSGVLLDRVRLLDVAPTAARLLSLSPPPVEGRVLEEILR